MFDRMWDKASERISRDYVALELVLLQPGIVQAGRVENVLESQ